MADHPIVHVDFSAQNPEEAGKFYADLFGWSIRSMPEFDYVTFQPESGPGGGFMKPDNEMYNAGDVIVYVETDDIEASLARAESLGGKTLLSKTEIPGIGWFAFFSDPTGNRVGLYTGLEEPT